MCRPLIDTPPDARRGSVQRRRLLLPLSALALVLLALPGRGSVAAAVDGVPDLRDVQDKARRASEKVRHSVVAVGRGSGVIVSPDGLVLSQHHVTHGFDSQRKPGDHVEVVLADGRRLEAELLGADRTHDLSLARLPAAAPGPYPFVALKGDVNVTPGEWVLEFGHPFSYQPGRPALARLGRVISRIGDAFCTDCVLTNGDSGGPFFNLDGDLVGLLHTGAAESIRHLEGDAVLEERYGALMLCMPAGVIARLMGPMTRGEVSDFAPAESQRFPRDLLAAPDRLALRDFVLGPRMLGAFPVNDKGRGSVVEVLNGGVQVALGTAVDGGVLSKASELPPRPQCRLPDGRVVDATVAAVDRASDLALLHLAGPDAGLRPVRFPDAGDQQSPPVGTLLAAVGVGEAPLAIGIVSAPRRDVPGAPPPTYTLPLRQDARPPGVGGVPQPDGTYRVGRRPGCAALRAGVRPGDVLLSLGGRAVAKDEDLAEAVRGHRSGDVITARLLRGGEELELKLPLGAVGSHEVNRSFRRGDFPCFFENALPTFPCECGGPLIDLDGRFVGINIARLGGHGSAAIPADRVRQVLADLRAGQGADEWKPVPDARAEP